MIQTMVRCIKTGRHTKLIAISAAGMQTTKVSRYTSGMRPDFRGLRMIPAETITIPTTTSVEIWIIDRKCQMNCGPYAGAKLSWRKLSVSGEAHERLVNPATACCTTTISHHHHNRSTALLSAIHSRKHFSDRPATIDANPKMAVNPKSKQAM